MLNLVHKELLKPKQKLYYLKIQQKCFTDDELAGSRIIFNISVLFIENILLNLGRLQNTELVPLGEELPPAALTQTLGCWTHANSLPCKLVLSVVCMSPCGWWRWWRGGW